MKTTLITGANRGLGLEFARQLKEKGYYVIGCSRHPKDAVELQAIADEVLPLDVNNDSDIDTLRQQLKGRPIDLLINNAGIIGDEGVTIGNIVRKNFLHVLNTNCISVVKISDALLENITASQDKQILVITSRMGSISDNERGRTYAYRTSKAALNCVMRSFAIDVEPQGVKVILMHPGWVKTNMGGDDALIDAKTSVSGILKEAYEHFSHSHAEVIRRFDGGTIAW